MDEVERRSQPRKSQQIRAAAILDGDMPNAVDCVILDASPTGAKLRASPDVEMPDRFLLRIPVLNAVRRVEVRCRRGEEIAVEFDVPCNELAALVEGPDPTRRRIDILRRLAAAEERFALSQRAAPIRSACVERGGANPTSRRHGGSKFETRPGRAATS
jgi:hypothetical protein